MGIVVYEDTPVQAEPSPSLSLLAPEMLTTTSCQGFNQLEAFATVAKTAPNLALMSQIPQQEHGLFMEWKRVVNRYQFESITHRVEAVG